MTAKKLEVLLARKVIWARVQTARHMGIESTVETRSTAQSVPLVP